MRDGPGPATEQDGTGLKRPQSQSSKGAWHVTSGSRVGTNASKVTVGLMLGTSIITATVGSTHGVNTKLVTAGVRAAGRRAVGARVTGRRAADTRGIRVITIVANYSGSVMHFSKL